MCNEVELLQVIVIIKNIFIVVASLIPLFLVILWTIDLMKVVVANKQDVIIYQVKQMLVRLFVAILIFCSPYYLNLVLNGISESDAELACIKNISAETITQMYIDRADNALSSLEGSMDEEEVAQTLRYVNAVKDQEIRDGFQQRLDTVQDKITASKKVDNSVNNGNTGNGGNTDSGNSNSTGNKNSSSVVQSPSAETPVNSSKDFGDFPYFNQCSGTWKDLSINGYSSYCNAGCGYTSLAMIVSYFEGKTVKPNEVGKKLGLSSALPYSTLSNKSTMQSKLGITPTALYSLDRTGTKSTADYKKQQIMTALSRGEPIVVYVPGHYIVLTGAGGNNVNVYDPGKRAYTKQYTIDEAYNLYWDYKDRCSSSGGEKCGFQYAVSYKKA